MKYYNNPKGTFRAYYLSLLICIGAFMQGYDSGVAGGILSFTSFSNDYHYNPKTQKTRVNALTVGMQQLGAFVACPIIYPLSSYIGRRKAIMISAAIFLAGTIVQTIDTGSLPAWYVVRLIAGFGQGGCSVVIPMFSSEMAPKEIRGKLGALYQWMYTLGIFTSYWINYGVKTGISGSESRQWQIPVGLQLISASILGLGMLTIPESIRWLLHNNKPEAAWKSLTWMRADSGPRAAEEFEEIKRGLAFENKAKAGFRYTELVEWKNAKRILFGCALFMFQQSTGATALAYYGPQFFGLLVGGSNTNRALLLTGIFGAVKLVACSFFVLVLSELLARKTQMVGGALLMATCMLPTALILKFHGPPKDAPDDAPVSGYGIGTIALIYINIIFYNWSWGPVPWAYVPELFQTRLRDIGMAFSVASHWLFSFVFSFSTPYMIDNIGWGTFLFYFAADVAIAPLIWYFLTETRGKGLEYVQQDIDGVYDDMKPIKEESPKDGSPERAAEVSGTDLPKGTKVV